MEISADFSVEEIFFARFEGFGGVLAVENRDVHKRLAVGHNGFVNRHSLADLGSLRLVVNGRFNTARLVKRSGGDARHLAPVRVFSRIIAQKIADGENPELP